MAIQCWMCSEILVEGEELAEAQTTARAQFVGGRAIPVHSGCCPECMGIQTGSALRLKAVQNQLTAA